MNMFTSRRIFLASTPCMQPACSLHAGRRRRCAGRRPRNAGRRRPAHGRSTPGMCTYISMLGGYTWSVMQPACSTACRLHCRDAATCNLLHTIVCRLHAACMQPACSLHASLVWHWHNIFTGRSGWDGELPWVLALLPRDVRTPCEWTWTDESDESCRQRVRRERKTICKDR